MYQGKNFNRLSAVLFCIVIEIYFVNEANTHPLKNGVKTKDHSRDKREIDILAECDTECLPREEIKEYDILLYYEYEDVTEYPFLYSYFEPYKEKEKSCMYRCMILELNNTKSVKTTTFREERMSVNITDRPVTHTVPPVLNITVNDVTSGIGLRFNIHSMKPHISHKTDSSTLTSPIGEPSSTTNRPIILVPKKIILSVLEAEMMEVGEKPPPLATTSSITIKETQTPVPKHMDEISSRTSLAVKNKIGTETTTENDGGKADTPTLKPIDEQKKATSPKSKSNSDGLSNFLKVNNISDRTPLNNIVMKVPNTDMNGSDSEILINDSEVKCKIYLINENSPGATSPSQLELDVYDPTTKQPTNEAKGTTNKPAQNIKQVTNSFGNFSTFQKNSETENPNFGTTEKLETNNPKNATLTHGKREYTGLEFDTVVVDKGDTISYRLRNSYHEENVSNHYENTMNSTTPELELQNVTDTNILTDLVTENISSSVETEFDAKNALSLNIDNYTFHGNFTAINKSNIPERLQMALVENLRKVDNTSTVIVSPQIKIPKPVTKLDKVTTAKTIK